MRRLVIRFALLALVAALRLALPSPAALAAPEGTLTWGVHVTLAARWLDPNDTEAFIARSWCSTPSTTPS